MTIHDNLLNLIVNSLKNNAVATVVGINSTDWANYHIFVGQEGNIGGVNRGRKFGAYVVRNTSNYDMLTLDSGGTGGGQVNTTFRVTFFACASSNRRHNDSESKLYGMATAFIKQLRTNWDFAQEDAIIGKVDVFPFGYQLNVDLNVSNSWNTNTL